MQRSRAGFSLIELVLAIVILGSGLTVIYQSMMVNMRVMGSSRNRQDVAYVFSLGEIAHPLHDIEDPEEDIPVEPDYSLREGYIFERTVDEKEEPAEDVVDDRLYTVRTIVSREDGSCREEIVSYYRHTESSSSNGSGSASKSTQSSSKAK